VGVGRDDSLYALIDGIVTYRKTNRTYVAVLPQA
jgi:large subunit ribosomal protein L27